MGILICIESKLFLIDHYFDKLKRIKILFLYFLIIFFFYFHYKNIKKNNDIILIFLTIFISSLISPIIFIIISNKVSFLYHFNNLVVISVFLFFIIFFISCINHFFSGKNLFNINKNYFILGILILILFYNFNSKLKNFNDIKINEEIKEINKLFSNIKNNEKIKINENNILTFNNSILVWSILSDVKNLKIIDGTFSAKMMFD